MKCTHFDRDAFVRTYLMAHTAANSVVFRAFLDGTQHSYKKLNTKNIHSDWISENFEWNSVQRFSDNFPGKTCLSQILWKMEPMLTIRKILAWLCIYPAEKTTSFKKKCACIAFSSSVAGIIVLLLISSALSANKFKSIDFAIFFYTIYQIIVWYVTAN